MLPRSSFRTTFLEHSPGGGPLHVWKALRTTSVEVAADQFSAVLHVPFVRCETRNGYGDRTVTPVEQRVIVRVYSGGIVRLTLAVGEGSPESDATNPMLCLAPDVQPVRLALSETPEAWVVQEIDGPDRLTLDRSTPATRPWSKLIIAPELHFTATVHPGDSAETAIPFSAEDRFTPRIIESLPLAYLEQPATDHKPARPVASLAAWHARPDEVFSGTGERFAPLNLSGQTLVLENADALGVNNRRAYKNIPFVLSSRGYGVFANTSETVRLSLADVSTRSAIFRHESPVLDLFWLGGPPAEVLRHYRRLTGFPPAVPRWSLGVWMSRMTYFSAQEIETIAARLRAERFPCDVLHIDTGWFRQDWVCEWEFSPERFPDPAGFMARLREQGFRTSLWQTPEISAGSSPYDEAVREGYVAKFSSSENGSNFDDSGAEKRCIDFTHPGAIKWYQGMLRRLHELGAAVIKTDFGETINANASYHGLAAQTLRNRYALLYQAAAYEVAQEFAEREGGEALIWARSGWAGAQRTPVHWAGDGASTWDGLAATLRGGLHLGLSGFAYWSHDVAGFHGLPDFMNSWPEEELYLRWTQFGVFSSHLRFHGASPREPWDYPGVASDVRHWFNLRYALIPYLEREHTHAIAGGEPMLRALPLAFPSDPTAWTIDNQYLFGRDFLVAPMLTGGNTRRVYLPHGDWIDFWSGERLTGSGWWEVSNVESTLMPLLLCAGAEVPLSAQIMQHTAELREECTELILADETYSGFHHTTTGRALDWPSLRPSWSRLA
jgi:alpha-D-xyloside xylohydrolase